MRHAARWLTRHLDDPKLVLWLTRRGTRIHPEFAEHVDLRLQELDELERSGKTDELRRIRNNAPRAIPRPMMRVLWRVLLAGQVTGAVPAFNLDWFTWRRRFERDGLTLASRFELRDMLTPRVSVLGEPIPWDLGQKAFDEAQRIADLVDWKIVLSIDDVHSALENLQQSPRWPEALPVVLDDFSALLRDAMDLARELGGVDNQHDRSYIGEFNWSSQHLDDEVLQCRDGNGDGQTGRVGLRCVRLVGRRQRGVRSSNGSGRRSRGGCRVRMPLCPVACRRPWVVVGSVRAVVCRRSAWRPDRLATCPWRSGKRSRSCELRAPGCVTLPVGSGEPRRLSRESYVATRRLGAAVWRIGRRLRSGIAPDVPSARR